MILTKIIMPFLCNRDERNNRIKIQTLPVGRNLRKKVNINSESTLLISLNSGMMYPSSLFYKVEFPNFLMIILLLFLIYITAIGSPFIQTILDGSSRLLILPINLFLPFYFSLFVMFTRCI